MLHPQTPNGSATAESSISATNSNSAQINNKTPINKSRKDARSTLSNIFQKDDDLNEKPPSLDDLFG